MTDKIEQNAAVGAGAVFSRGQRAALLAGFALLVMLRIPRAWIRGRFQDEEATVFLAYAWHRPWLDALFRPFAGYWNLGASATTLLVARLVKGGIVALEAAPYLTMTMALAVQLLPAVLILTGSAHWLERRVMVITALLTMAIAPGIEEVFFNVLHIQFHLALCVALILALDSPRRVIVRLGYGVLLFAAPLCGPAALAFLPLFALRGWIDRDWRRLDQFIAFAAGGAVQLLFFYGPSPLRGHVLDPGTIAAAIFVRLIAMPALGFGKAELFGNAIVGSQLRGGSGWWWSVAAAVGVFATLLYLATRRKDAALWLLLSSLSIATVSFGFGMIMLDRYAPFDLDAERYTFLPLVLLGLALAVMASRPDWNPRYACAVALLVMLETGVSRYPRPLIGLRDGPSWPAEVAAWRRDHHHPLAVWPRPWKADLSDQARVCSPPGADLARSTDPRYCENGWAGAFYRPRPAS
ncbi:hypothetical protein FHS31_000118 [Sphingomonas vulcanisoli]|uniref:CPBP family intramembrane metalloprotease n=1 Tax=Sphingomonas vulcanisoli TaxID=1658060 RepID=A0ABX0TSE7_9SPHN|nr:hypothetical protein [Sphingomonas vulcanisoli]NIJ06536.1 hypothetical protein [Sphingomonas vulcanisoli]